MHNKPSFPAIVITIFIMASFGMICLGHLLTNTSLFFVQYFRFPGVDYNDFFQASEKIINGQSPYSIESRRYVDTPIPAIFNLLLVHCGFEQARNFMFVIIPCSLLLGYLLAVNIFPFYNIDKDQISLVGLVCLTFGYPSYFLIQRGNIDRWVLLFLSLGLYFCGKAGNEKFSGLFFSLAIAFKIYPILIILPLIIYRRWTLLWWLALWLCVLGIISAPWLADFRDILRVRTQSFFRFDENGSIVATVALFLVFVNSIGASFSTK